MSYSLLFKKKEKKNELKAYREEILFLERLPRARFETEWNIDKCVSSIPQHPAPTPPRHVAKYGDTYLEFVLCI